MPGNAAVKKGMFMLQSAPFHLHVITLTSLSISMRVRRLAWYTLPMSFRPASDPTVCSNHRLLGACPTLTFLLRRTAMSDRLLVRRPQASLFVTGIFLVVLMCTLSPGDSLGRENTIFQQFTQHIGRQVHKDKQAFSQANSCISWFYK